MLNIKKISGVDCKQTNSLKNAPSFTSDNVSNMTALPDVRPDFNIKTPISYQKTDEIDLPYGFKAHCYKLANGQRIVIVPKEGTTVVQTYVNTGSFNEPDNLRGISHYIEHNLFNGSDGLKQGEFDKKVNEMGAETNASTGYSLTEYFIKSNLLKDTDLETKIKLHAKMVETPTFTKETLEKEKGIVNSEINMYANEPDSIIMNKTLKNLFNIKSNSKDLVAGSTDNITNLTRDDVVDYYNNNYFPANMVTVITGEAEPEETMKLVSKYFSGTNKVTHPRKFEELNPIEKTTREDIVNNKTVATKIMLGFKGPEANNAKDQICIDIIRDILTSQGTGRLEKALKPLNTNAFLFNEKLSSRSQDNMALLIATDTTEENCEKVLQTIYNQVYSLTTNSNFDLESIKKNNKKSYASNFEKSRNLNFLISDCILDDKMEYLTNYSKIVDSITKDDIINCAKKYLDLNKTAIVVIHPKDKVKQVAFTGNLDKKAINPGNVKRFLTNNNFDIITNNTKTEFSELVISYSMEDTPTCKPATSYILNEMLQEGTMFRNSEQLQTDLQKDCIGLGLHGSNHSITAYVDFSSENTDKAIKSTIENLQNPRFTQENFEYAKKKVIEDFSLMEKDVHAKLDKELFKELPAGYTKEEILDSVKDITLNDVKALYSTIINNGQGHVAISSNFEQNPQIQNIVFNNICSLPSVKPSKPFLRDTFKPTEETKVLTDTDEKSQARIVEAFKFKINGNMKDDVTIDLLNRILGAQGLSSRLFLDLREKQQLAYAVRSKYIHQDNSGVIKLFISTTTDNKEHNETSFDNVQKSIDGFNYHINKIKTEKVSEKELENAKLALKNDILNDTETNSGKNINLFGGSYDFYGPLSVNERLKIIDSITVDDIYNAAKYVFANNPTYSILATENTIKANEEYFKKLENN